MYDTDILFQKLHFNIYCNIFLLSLSVKVPIRLISHLYHRKIKMHRACLCQHVLEFALACNHINPEGVNIFDVKIFLM